MTTRGLCTCQHQPNLSNCRLLRLNKVLAVFLQTSLSLIVTYCLCQYLDGIFQKYRFYLPCFVEIVLTRKYTSISLWKANCYRCFLIVGTEIMLYYNVRLVQCVPKMRINFMTHLFVYNSVWFCRREKYNVLWNADKRNMVWSLEILSP